MTPVCDYIAMNTHAFRQTFLLHLGTTLMLYELNLSERFRCDEIRKSERYQLGHTYMCNPSRT
jgi:hypothetical protein